MVALRRMLKALRGHFARYRRAVAQPTRMSGKRIAFGNRR